MPTKSEPAAILRFGAFELDLRAGELRKMGVRIKLQEQPFQVLTVLVQHPGEVVTREELRSAIWPADTFVDFDNSLNTAVNKLRDALGDSADSPRFIETLPRRGLRFIVPVEGVKTERKAASPKAPAKSIAVLYFENLSGLKEDEHLRDGITEDIATELSKIQGLNTFSRSAVLGFRDKQVVPVQIGKQLKARYVLTGSLRRAGNRLRINAQLVDTHTDFLLWSERFDEEMKDVFAVQDEIARKVADALRVTLSPQELKEIAFKPTDNLRAYDFYLRGKRYARRQTRQDLEFALQMFENAVAEDSHFALAYAAWANACAMYYCKYSRDPLWIERARVASGKALELQWDLPEAQVSQAWVLYATDLNEEAVRIVQKAIERKPQCEGAYVLLCRALFSAGRYQEIVEVMEAAIEANGEDYNLYVPINNALGALDNPLSRRDILHRWDAVLETHLKEVPEDAMARSHLGANYATLGRVEEALREMNLAMALRSKEASILYSTACTYALLKKKSEALDALRKAWEAGFKDVTWARRDPDLALFHGDPEFERLCSQSTPSRNGPAH
jgi:TolB-like protein